MGTRSSIAVSHGGRIKAVYCHWDGYLDHNGRILLEHYNSAKANHLVSLGSLSSLRPRLEPTEDQAHSFETPLQDVCVFYGRDRDEAGQEWRSFANKQEWLAEYGQEYNYLMEDGVWLVQGHLDSDEFQLLHEALEEYDLAEEMEIDK